MPDHEYSVRAEWTSNLGTGISGYRDYSRDHDIRGATTDLPVTHGPADPAFRGDVRRWNPEQLLFASSSQCYMSWCPHFAADTDVTVIGYSDTPTGIMAEHSDGAGEFTPVILRPEVAITPGDDSESAAMLHDHATEYCLIIRSMNFPTHHEVIITTEHQETRSFTSLLFN